MVTEMQTEETPVHERGRPPDAPNSVRPQRDLTGRTLGDFKVERLLGRGGMGEVYLARQLSLDRPIALKVLKPDLLSNPTYLARFEKEALSSARLNHPNIVHVYSFGGDSALKYIAMEYVEGRNLKDYLAKKGPPALPQALSIMRQAGQAISAAGEIGLVHRDIKPENFLLTSKGQIKVADFGLCRTAAAAPELDLTQEGVTLGTPMYMSPEQVKGKELDHRSDLYSLGVTFYHMLAGVPPFKADTPIALALKHVQETPTSLAVHRPDLPPDLVALVMKLIEKDPANRYASAAEMLKALSRVRAGLSSPSMKVAHDKTEPLPSSLATTATQRTPGPALEWKQLGRQVSSFRPGRRSLALALVLAALAGALSGLGRRAPNLLSPRAARASGSPGLWMAAWQQVPPQTTAEAQYRYAQLQAPENDRVAAWLAVAGRFPGEEAWTSKAYIQLARSLFRQRDVTRLLALANQLSTSPRAQDQALARVALAGSAALKNEPEEVLAQFNETRFDLLDPGITELGFEIVEFCRQNLRNAPASVTSRLAKFRDNLADTLQIGPLMRMGLLDFD